MGLFIVLGGCTFGWYGRKMVGCFCEVEQTEGGFCCIVFHGVRGQREVLKFLSTVAATYLGVIVVVVGVGVDSSVE